MRWKSQHDKAYLNNDLEFTTTTDLMNLNFDPTDNPNALMNFFLDNTQGGGQGEFSRQRRRNEIFDGVLSDSQFAALDADSS